MGFCLEEAVGYLGWYVLAISSCFIYFMGYKTFLDILKLYPTNVRLIARSVTAFILVSCGATFAEHFNALHFFIFITLYAFYLRAMSFPGIVHHHFKIVTVVIAVFTFLLIFLWIQHLRERPVTYFQALGFLLTSQGVAPLLLLSVCYVDKGIISTFMRPYQTKAS